MGVRGDIVQKWNVVVFKSHIYLLYSLQHEPEFCTTSIVCGILIITPPPLLVPLSTLNTLSFLFTLGEESHG